MNENKSPKTTPLQINPTIHPMRRNKQQLSTDECLDILNQGSSGVLAVIDENGFPYAIPLSYAFVDCTTLSDSSNTKNSNSIGNIVFHSALSGHKISALYHCSAASFCVIDTDKVVPEKFTTAYRSVIAFGHANIVEDNVKRHAYLTLLGEKYSSSAGKEAINQEIKNAISRTCIIELQIQVITGKKGLEFN